MNLLASSTRERWRRISRHPTWSGVITGIILSFVYALAAFVKEGGITLSWAYLTSLGFQFWINVILFTLIVYLALWMRGRLNSRNELLIANSSKLINVENSVNRTLTKTSKMYDGIEGRIERLEASEHGIHRLRFQLLMGLATGTFTNPPEYYRFEIRQDVEALIRWMWENDFTESEIQLITGASVAMMGQTMIEINQEWSRQLYYELPVSGTIEQIAKENSLIVDSVRETIRRYLFSLSTGAVGDEYADPVGALPSFIEAHYKILHPSAKVDQAKWLRNVGINDPECARILGLSIHELAQLLGV